MLTKLKIKTEKNVLVLNLPNNLTNIYQFNQKDKTDILLDTIYELADAEVAINKFKKLDDDAVLYLIYPKLSTKNYSSTIHRDELTDKLVTNGLQPFKLISINEDFSCMGANKNLNKKTAKPSQCVDDYIDKIPSLAEELSQNQEALAIFNNLTFGYQKGWARYVYSVKREETKNKRLATTIDALLKNCKSIDMYK